MILGEDERSISLVGYADESKRSENHRSNNWSYIGILLIDEERIEEAHQILHQYRYRHSGEDDFYGKEIHFSGLTSRDSRSTFIASDWLEEVALDDRDIFNFVIFGLNHEELDHEHFGPGGSKQRETIYNRFFRSTLAQGINGCFGEFNTIILESVFHDSGYMEEHEMFSWHSLWRLDQRYDFLESWPGSITHIDSDIRHSEGHRIHSEFIQLIDVILGATRQCLDAPNKKQGCRKVAGKTWLKLVQRLTDPDRSTNPNSRFNHFRRCSLTFFPASSSHSFGQDHVNSGVYINRDCQLVERESGQMKLGFE